MCSINSDCSRIDAVKATANQLKLLKLQQVSERNGDALSSRAAKEDLLALEASIKAGDAPKAELALSNARHSISRQDGGAAIDREPQMGTDPGHVAGRLLAYA